LTASHFADLAVIDLHEVLDRNLFENLFNPAPVTKSESVSSFADTDNAANVLIVIVK
jgi:hypothetical protein